jgi:hypothetical protein
MNTVLKIGPIFCWAIAIGSEYLIQLWPQRKKLLNAVAICCFALALIGEYASYRYDSAKEAELEATVNAQGVPDIDWFQATDANEQKFTIAKEPIADSVEVLINGLIESGDIYTVHGKTVTVSAKMNHTDQVTIKYRHPR